MGMRSTTQAFQFNVPFEQLFQLATPAAQSVPKATVTLADPNRQVVTFDTPFSMMSWGENIVVGFIPLRPAPSLRSPARPRVCPTSCRTVVTAS